MAGIFLRSFASEWLKRKRSLTFWLVLGSAAFVPSIVFLSRFRRIDALPALYQQPRFWDTLWVQSWEAMAVMILPLAVMLMVSLITQIEDRNNAWKQLHASPQPLAAIFFAKLIVIVLLVAQLLGLFLVAIYLSGILPAMIFPRVPRPAVAFPTLRFATRALAFLADVLPVVALQYALALRFRTFLTPLGIGMGFWILSIGTINWHYRLLVPYSYPAIDYLRVEYARPLPAPAPLPVIASGVFIVFIVAGYTIYALRRDKG